MEHADQASGLPGLDAERHDVLDLEVDRISDPDAVTEALLDNRDRGSLDAEQLADRAGPAQPSARPFARRRRRVSFSNWSSVASSSTNMPSRQLPSVMTFGRVCDNSDRASADIRSLNIALCER